MASLTGRQLGPYLLEHELGRGSMGVVYRARDVAQGRPVAVKVLLDVLAHDQSFITRFIREARVVGALDHPNIVRVFDAGRQGEQIYFAMEYVDGVTAGELLRARHRLPTPLVIEIAAQAASALAYAHEAGHLVHRDIKPENLLVDRHWQVKVLDFGLARIQGSGALTQVGTVVGSLYYVSPEHLLHRTVDGRTDVYALGISMYELLTGLRPYRGQTLMEMSDAILYGIAERPSHIEPSISPEMEGIVAKAMARDLRQRYPDASALADDLRALASHLAHRRQSSQPVPSPSRPSPSRPSQAPGPVVHAPPGQWAIPAQPSQPLYGAPGERTSGRRASLRPHRLEPLPDAQGGESDTPVSPPDEFTRQ